MAMKVPNPYEQNVAIGPTGGLSGLQKAPETKYGLDKVVSGATGAFAKAVGQWQDEIDRTNAQDAINKTDRQLQDLETNKDSGWANILGENALNRPDGKSLVDEYLEKAKQIMDGHRSALKTPAARRYYEKYAQTAYQQEGNRLQTHLVTQQKNYAKATDQLTIDMAREQARSGDLNRMRSGFATMDVMMQKLANQTGLPVDRYKMIGSLHLEAIENFIDDKKPDAANAWLSANKDSMSPDQIRNAKELIKKGKTAAFVDSETGRILSNSDRPEYEIYKDVLAIKDKDVREKVWLNVGKEMGLRAKQRAAEVEELKKQAYQITIAGEELPETLLEDIRKRDSAAYEKVVSDNIKQRMSSMPSGDIERMLDSSLPGTSKKTASSILEKRKADPVGVAIKSGLLGFEALKMDTPENLAVQLQARSENIATLSNWYKSEPALLSKEEKETLNTKLDALKPVERSAFLRKISATLPEESQFVLAKQIGGTTEQAIYLQVDPFTSGLTTTYLQGKQALGEKQAAVSWIKTDQSLGTPKQWEKLNGLYDDPLIREHVMDAVEGVAAGYVLSGDASMGDAFDKAFKAVVGEIEEYNGRKVALRNGATMYDVRRTIVGIRNTLKNDDSEVAFVPDSEGKKSGRMTGKQFGTYLLNAQLVPAPGGDNMFYVVAGDTYVYNKKGVPWIVNVEAAQ